MNPTFKARIFIFYVFGLEDGLAGGSGDGEWSIEIDNCFNYSSFEGNVGRRILGTWDHEIVEF